ncbi:MAG: hypothetical protein Q9225_005892 [Loekoesia sp. 1 TL-2023]
MAPLHKPNAKRRWTLTRSHRAVENESSEEDNGEEILPTIDQEALATLPPEDQEQFKKTRKKDRKNIIARWRKEGKPIPESNISNSSERAGALVQRSSSAPQLPELQMDVTRETLSSAIESSRQSSATAGSNIHEQSLSAGQSELTEGQESRPASITHTATLSDQATAHSSSESEDSDETSLWLRVMDSDRYTRGRRRFRGPLQDLTGTTAGEGPSLAHEANQTAMDPSQRASTTSDSAFNNRFPRFGMTAGASSASASVAYGPTGDAPTSSADLRDENRQHESAQTVEQRKLKKLHEDEAFLQKVKNNRDREYARFRGVGPAPPGLALSGNAPSSSERTYARTVTNVYGVVRSTGQLHAHDAVAVARGAAVAGHPDAAGNGFSEAHETLFVRPSPSLGQGISPVRHWQEQAHAQGMQLSPPSTADSEQRDVLGRGKGKTKANDGTERLREGIVSNKISPIKRMAQKVGSGVKGMFKGREERVKAPSSGHPASELRLHDEARVGTATAVTMTPVRAPRPTQTQHLQRTPSPLQPAPAPPSTRRGSPGRRTTRAMMENYD